MSSFIKISVIIVNYNSTQHTKRLINSLAFIDKYIDEIIIIDNNSKDIEKIETSPKVILVRNKNNFGFAKAVNQGIKIANSKYILLLNPDTILIDNSIEILFKQIDLDTKIGAIGGKIQEMESNNFHLSATNTPGFLTALFEFSNLKKIFPNNYFSKHFWVENNYEKNIPIRVTSLCGAFILFRKKLNNSLLLFDESFFLYMEDVDFGININKKGYKVIFDPRVFIKHIGGASSNSKYNIVLKHWYHSRKVYFKKHLPLIQSLILNIYFNLEQVSLYVYHSIKHEPNT